VYRPQGLVDLPLIHRPSLLQLRDQALDLIVLAEESQVVLVAVATVLQGFIGCVLQLRNGTRVGTNRRSSRDSR
jgi:hypothetical protein